MKEIDEATTEQIKTAKSLIFLQGCCKQTLSTPLMLAIKNNTTATTLSIKEISKEVMQCIIFASVGNKKHTHHIIDDLDAEVLKVYLNFFAKLDHVTTMTIKTKKQEAVKQLVSLWQSKPQLTTAGFTLQNAAMILSDGLTKNVHLTKLVIDGLDLELAKSLSQKLPKTKVEAIEFIGEGNVNSQALETLKENVPGVTIECKTAALTATPPKAPSTPRTKNTPAPVKTSPNNQSSAAKITERLEESKKPSTKKAGKRKHIIESDEDEKPLVLPDKKVEAEHPSKKPKNDDLPKSSPVPTVIDTKQNTAPPNLTSEESPLSLSDKDRDNDVSSPDIEMLPPDDLDQEERIKCLVEYAGLLTRNKYLLDMNRQLERQVKYASARNENLKNRILGTPLNPPKRGESIDLLNEPLVEDNMKSNVL